MAVNLIDSTDITVTQAGENIQLETTVDMQTLESNVNTNTSNIAILQSNITNLQTYSSNETVCGIWIDDKPIYRKVVSVPVNNLVGGQTLTVAHGISNLKYVTHAYGSFLRENSITFNLLPSTYTNWEVYLYDFGISSFSVRASVNQVNSGIDSMYVVIEYTKTTD